MPEYVLITDPDGTNRTVPKSNVPFVQKLNDGNKEHERLKIGQTFADEDAANAYVKANPFVHGHSPIKQVDLLKTALGEKDSEIERLKAEMAKLQKAQTPKPVTA